MAVIFEFKLNMKKLLFISAIASALVFGACSTKSADNATEINNIENAASDKNDVTIAPVATDGKVIELKDAALFAPGVKVDQLTVLDFNAVWCGPCRQLAPVLEEMAEKYKGRATFVSVDVDSLGELFEAYNMGQSIPAVLFIRPDGTTQKYVGTNELLPAESFSAIIEANL